MPCNFHHEIKLLELLGALWSRNYNTRDALITTAEVNLDLLEQAKIDLQEAIDCTDRHTVPILHVERRFPLILRAPGPDFAVTVEFRSVPLLVNRLTSPSLVWHEGLDYEVRTELRENALGRRVCFKKNPFDEPLIPKTDDGELILWGVDAKFDKKYLDRHFGYLLGFKKQSTAYYKAILNAIFDTMAYGTSFGTFETLCHALAGIPLAENDGEVIEGLWHDARGPFVATDAQIYRLSETLAERCVRVLPGQRLNRGEPVIKIYEIEVIGPHEQKLIDGGLHSNVVVVRGPEDALDMTILRHALSPDFELLHIG